MKISFCKREFFLVFFPVVDTECDVADSNFPFDSVEFIVFAFGFAFFDGVLHAAEGSDTEPAPPSSYRTDAHRQTRRGDPA